MTVAAADVKLERVLPDGGRLTFEERASGYRAYRYTAPGETASTRLQSVTTILGATLPKRALLDWYEARGASAAVERERAGALTGVDPDDVVDVLRRDGYGAKAHAAQAATRGKAVHAVLETWATDGTLANPADYPPDYRPYLQGLAAFLAEREPVPTQVERLVVDPAGGYAGRYDLRAVVDGRDTIIDLKTNRGGVVYVEAHLQARGYDEAEQAQGEPPADQHLLVAVAADGTYRAVPGLATRGDWRDVLTLNDTVRTLDAAVKAQRRVMG